MKKFLTILAFLLPLLISAQNWCPNGATWHYSFWNVWVVGYFKIEYVGDTTVNTVQCKMLIRTVCLKNVGIPNSDSIVYVLGKEYTYADNDKVYIYKHNQFYTLYDFSANTGDTWTVPEISRFDGCDTVGTVKVDSAGTVMINNQNLRYICVSPADTSQKWGWCAKIVEKIGPIKSLSSYPYSYLLPQKFDYCGMFIDQVIEGGNFRCYSDNDLFSYTSNIAPSCDYITSINTINNISDRVKVYPNPSNGSFSIELDKSLPVKEIMITNLLGKNIFRQQINDEKVIDINNLASGSYILSIISKDMQIINKRIISCP